MFGAMPGDRSMGIPGKRVGYMPQVKKKNQFLRKKQYACTELVRHTDCVFNLHRNWLCMENLLFAKLCITLEESTP